MPPPSYECQLDPDTGTTLKLYLYKNVQNVEQIRTNVMKSIWQCTVIKPSLVLDPFQVVAAANKAVVSQKDDTMTTKSVNSEILFNLSLTKNISQSLTKFGIEKDGNILIGFLAKTGKEDKSEEVLSQINGEICPISDLDKFSDVESIKKAYKIKEDSRNQKLEKSDIVDLIVSRMATKNFVSH